MKVPTGRLGGVLRLTSGQHDFARACAAVLLLNAPDSSVTTVAPAYLQSLGYRLVDIGFLVSAYAIASLVSRLPAGRLADGRRARTWFMLSCVLFALALALYPVATDAWAFWVVRGLHGLAFGVATTMNLAAVLSVDARSRARSMSIFTAMMAGGYTIGNLMGGFLADWLGYSATFTAVAIFPLLAAALGTSAGSHAARATTKQRWIVMLARPEVRGVLLLSVAVNLLHQSWGTLFPLYVVAMGAGLSLAGGVRAVHSFTNTISRPFGDPLVRRFGAAGLACFGLAVYALGIAALPLTTAPLVLLALAAVIGVGRASAYLANVVTTAELSERGIVNRGTASALMTLGGDAGSILAPIVAGGIANQIGIGAAMQSFAVSVAIVGVAAVLTSRVRSTEDAELIAQPQGPR